VTAAKKASNIMMLRKKKDLNQKSIRAIIFNANGENAEKFGENQSIKY
jgi:hypothetical protein